MPARTWRIGVLGAVGGGGGDGPYWPAFVDELHRRGRSEGRDFTLVRRYAEPGDLATLAQMATELVAMRVDLIYAIDGSPSALAARRATQTIPIVFFSSADPVGLGLVRELSRPGGNATGSMPMAYESAAKGLEILAELLRLMRHAVFFLPRGQRAAPWIAGLERALQRTASRLAARLSFVEHASADELLAGLPALVRQGVDAVMLFDFPPFQEKSDRIAEALIAHKLPSYGHAAGGFLLQITQDRHQLARNSARHVDRILDGARPAELPVDQLSVHQLVINLRTARAIGLRIPRAVLARAAEVIE
jgi:putative ABC transport system substrate-binding protein